MQNQKPKKPLRIWWKNGLFFGIFMFITSIGTDYLRYHALEIDDIIRNFFLWLAFGMIFGYLGRKFNWL